MTASHPQIPDGSVIITPSQVYEEVRATRELVQALAAQLDDVPQTLRDHEERLRVLERGRWPLPALTALIALASMALALWQASGR